MEVRFSSTAKRKARDRIRALEKQLRSNDAGPPHFFFVACRVGDDPMPRLELHCLFALIGDADRVQEEPLALLGIGVLGRIAGPDLNADALGGGFGRDRELSLGHAVRLAANRHQICRATLLVSSMGVQQCMT